MVDIVDIELSRGQAGLGFNIKGGVDIPHVQGDPGIFIAKIRERGAATDDGRLKEGDKIIEINGHDVTKVQHQDAVAHFLNAGNKVKLKVIQGAEKSIKESLQSSNGTAKWPKQINMPERDSRRSSGLSNTALAVIGVGTLVCAVILGYRYFIKRS